MKEASKKCVVVSTFNRPEHLDRCLNSIVTATGFDDYNLVVLFQKGSHDVLKVLERYQESIDFLCTVNGENKSPLHNINWNRYSTYEIAFNLFNAEFVLGVEDDTVISSDALVFCDEIYAKYKDNRKFRGINLGSFEAPDNTQPNTFSILRYGLHGQAGVITQRVWSSFSSGGIPGNIATEPLDSMLELRLKTGFMVTSNRSRYLDTGWGGTHAPASQDDDYFVNLRKSWVGDEPGVNQFFENNIRHSWRKDAILYRTRDSLAAYLRLLKYWVKNFKIKRKN
jgi:glycosyltransferase involved in cell wall biosynthesis